MIPRLLIGIATVLLGTGCQSTLSPQMGMTEKQWLRRTFIADLAYMEGNVKAYRSNGAYYYFRDGVLVKVDQGMLPAQKIELDLRTTSSEPR